MDWVREQPEDFSQKFYFFVETYLETHGYVNKLNYCIWDEENPEISHFYIQSGSIFDLNYG